jgi:hypothetical protein
MESKGRRAQRMYHVTDAGQAAHVDWLRQPVVPATVGADLGLHLMRFALMESRLPRAAIRAFLEDLANALDTFVIAMEQYLASGVQSGRPHAELAIKHGIAVHRASLDWTRSALAALPSAPAPGRSDHGFDLRSGPAGKPGALWPTRRDCPTPARPAYMESWDVQARPGHRSSWARPDGRTRSSAPGRSSSATAAA